MSGRLQSSGAISLNDINVLQGIPSGTFITMNDTLVRAFAGARTAGSAVNVSNLYGRAVTLDVSVSSPFGNGVVTPTITIASAGYFDASQVPTGSTIKITSLVTAAWVNPPYSVEYTFTMGTAATYQHGGTGGGKNYYIQTRFSGTSVYCYGYYSGSSTNTPNGTVSITRLSLV
jgi:hypothetical protein